MHKVRRTGEMLKRRKHIFKPQTCLSCSRHLCQHHTVPRTALAHPSASAFKPTCWATPGTARGCCCAPRDRTLKKAKKTFCHVHHQPPTWWLIRRCFDVLGVQHCPDAFRTDCRCRRMNAECCMLGWLAGIGGTIFNRLSRLTCAI